MDVKSFALSALQSKSVSSNAEYWRIKGIASTPTPDRSNDIVEPLGAQFQIPLPLLWQHDNTKKIGHVIMAAPNKNGIPFEAQIPKVSEPGVIKDRIDEVIHSLKYDLVSDVSIGFRALEYSFLENDGIHFKQWEWLELSLVTIPANSEARIESVKSLDRIARAASGIIAPSSDIIPAASGSKRIKLTQKGLKYESGGIY